MVATVEQNPRIVCARAYLRGTRVADIALDEAGAWASKPNHLVWIGLYEPVGDELATLQEQFGLDPLAIEDAAQAHERPKMQRYGDSLFVVVRTAELIGDCTQFGETHIFTGKGYVVTVRHSASVAYRNLRAMRKHPGLARQG